MLCEVSGGEPSSGEPLVRPGVERFTVGAVEADGFGSVTPRPTPVAPPVPVAVPVAVASDAPTPKAVPTPDADPVDARVRFFGTTFFLRLLATNRSRRC